MSIGVEILLQVSHNTLMRAEEYVRMLNSTVTLEDLRIPPANRLEKLSGDRRINDQRRICFEWIDGYVNNVEIVDYH